MHSQSSKRKEYNNGEEKEGRIKKREGDTKRTFKK